MTGKVLSFGSGFFRLPDDFSGTVSDALHLLAKYHEVEGATNPHQEHCQISVGMICGLDSARKLSAICHS